MNHKLRSDFELFKLCRLRLNPFQITLIRSLVFWWSVLSWGASITAENPLATVLQKRLRFDLLSSWAILWLVFVNLLSRCLVFSCMWTHLKVMSFQICFLSLIQASLSLITLVIIVSLCYRGDLMLQTISKFEVIVSVFVNQLFQTIVFLRLLLNKPRIDYFSLRFT